MTNKNVFKNRVMGAGMTVISLASAVGPAASVFADDAKPTNVDAVNGTAEMKYAETQGVNNPIAADGTLTINGAKATQSIKNKKFEIFRLFNAENAKAGESINYTFNEKYADAIKKVVAAAINRTQGKDIKPEQVSEYMALDYMYSLDEHQKEGATTQHKLNSSYSAYRYFIEDLRTEIKAQGIAGDTVTVQSVAEGQNSIQLTGLSWGYYLVDEISEGDSVSNGKTTNKAQTPDGHDAESAGKHFASSLILVDTVNNTAEMTLKSDYPEVTKKIKEDDDKVGKAKDGWNDLGDFEIGQTIPFEYDANVPNMNGYHEYYFKFVDRANASLTMNTNKDDIKIKITKGDKTFEVPSDAWSISAQNNVTQTAAETAIPLDKDATFSIEFSNFKKVVDEAFPEIIDEKTKEGDYSDMNIHVDYTGFINDSAQDKTGRAGFENDVKLVYSNNPDDTGEPGRDDKPVTPGPETPHGETPWDTVVAFTYKVNAVKTNQDGYKLGDAEFKLYEDEAMTKEIKVKAVADSNLATEAGTNATPKAKEAKEAKAETTDAEATATSDKAAEATATENTDAAEATAADQTATENADTAEATDPKDAQKPGSPYINEEEHAGSIEEVGTEGTTTNKLNTEAEHSENNRYVVVSNDGKNNDGEGAVIRSDKDGNFVISGLDSGTYYLKETKAPEGYRKLEKPIKLEIKSTFVDDRDHYVKGDGATADKALKELAATGLITEFYDGIFKKDASPLKTDVQSGTINANVVNRKMPKLPLTGSQLQIGIYAAAALLVAGAVIISRQRKNKTEE